MPRPKERSNCLCSWCWITFGVYMRQLSLTGRWNACAFVFATYTFTLLKPFWWIYNQRQGEGGKDCVITWAKGDGQRLKPLWPQGASLLHLSSVVASVLGCSLYPLPNALSFSGFCIRERNAPQTSHLSGNCSIKKTTGSVLSLCHFPQHNLSDGVWETS